ncbi:MAG: S1 RNA-binding domain-containing protein [Patescibacteria group bacterium]|nr:S1 RNA-binding domain-containing protein [Patescibacteria group bacterium]
MSKNISDITQEIDDVLEMSASAKKSLKSNKNSSLMKQLLEDHPMKMLQVGEKIEGLVVGIDSKALYIDLELFGSGIVYGKEIKDGFGANRKKLEIGDKVVAVIQDLENEDGYVELSIREAVLEEVWKDLIQKKDSREPVDTKILDANKGGLMVEINGVTGFMPVSQLTSEHYPRVEDGDKNKILEILRTYIGTEMSVSVLDVDQQEDKLIVSEKEANRDKEKTAISELKVGNIIEGDVSGVVDFGAFVKFFPPSKKGSMREEDKLEGLVHISQLDWQLIDDPRKIIKVGDRIKAKIISIDDTRISLSVRDLKKDPWVAANEKYGKDDIVKGKVHKINHFGAFVYLDNDIHGLAHVSGFEAYPQKGIDEIVKIGEEYMWQIMSIEPSEHRMGLKYAGETEKVKPSKVGERKEIREPGNKKEDKKNFKNRKKKEDKKEMRKSVKNGGEPKDKKEERKKKKDDDKNGKKKKRDGKKESDKKKEPKDKNGGEKKEKKDKKIKTDNKSLS